jgi:hypothetical protein
LVIVEISHAAHRLDAWLRRSLGRPYHMMLGLGLVLEIIARIRELYEAPATASGIVRLMLVLLLYLVLLVHQVGELSPHAERRGRFFRDGR